MLCTVLSYFAKRQGYFCLREKEIRPKFPIIGLLWGGLNDLEFYCTENYLYHLDLENVVESFGDSPWTSL